MTLLTWIRDICRSLLLLIAVFGVAVLVMFYPNVEAAARLMVVPFGIALVLGLITYWTNERVKKLDPMGLSDVDTDTDYAYYMRASKFTLIAAVVFYIFTIYGAYKMMDGTSPRAWIGVLMSIIVGSMCAIAAIIFQKIARKSNDPYGVDE